MVFKTTKPATIAGFAVLKTICVLVGTRTLDPLIKSQLLYQLSYEDITVSNMLTVYEDNKFIKSNG